ncbi:MAG TPA: hypothetical protein PKY25_00220 [Bacilli bacterium]|nr:hypothetical protein [Bacilli bacterium]
MKITRTEIFMDIYKSYELMKDTSKNRADLSRIFRNYIRILMKDNSFHIVLCIGFKIMYNTTPFEKRIKKELSNLLNVINNDINYTKLENNIFSKLLKILGNKNISIDRLDEVYNILLSLVFQSDMRKDYLESYINKFNAYLYAAGSYENIITTDYDTTDLMSAKEKIKELTKS